jgi:hypothetical protein
MEPKAESYQLFFSGAALEDLENLAKSTGLEPASVALHGIEYFRRIGPPLQEGAEVSIVASRDKQLDHPTIIGRLMHKFAFMGGGPPGRVHTEIHIPKPEPIHVPEPPDGSRPKLTVIINDENN